MQYSPLPVLGDNVPQRSFSQSRLLWRGLLRLQGWKVLGVVPNIPKAILIGAPHTSNMDGVYGIEFALALGLEVSVMVKDELYRPPFRAMLDWVNAVPVHRASATGLVEQMCDTFNKRDKFWLFIAPEGTRKSAPSWKGGFYRIAVAAQVPIVMIGFNYEQQAFVFFGVFEPTGDFEADLPKILEFYKGLKGGSPDNLSLPLRNLENSSIPLGLDS